jgi:hypothetical protein
VTFTKETEKDHRVPLFPEQCGSIPKIAAGKILGIDPDEYLKDVLLF